MTATIQHSGAGPRGLDLAVGVRRPHFTLDLACTVPPGQIVAVIGPNGAGKSTLLQAISGLTPLSSGHIELDGVELDQPRNGVFRPASKRPVALVFQDYRLFPHLSVVDNVAFADRIRGTGRLAARRAAHQWLERLDIADLAQRRPGQISGGQAQRVALARALASAPSALLLDEPLAALDPRTRGSVRGLLRTHLRNFAGPSLLVTHDPLEAMTVADRLIVLEDGRVVQDGTPAEVASRPRTGYVAGFVGLNLYAGTRDAATGLVTLTTGGALSAADVQGEVHGHVLVSLRPSAITITRDEPGPASARNVWPGVVTDLEFVSDRVRVHVEGTPDALVDVTATAVAELRLEAGQRVWLSAKATETAAYPE